MSHSLILSDLFRFHTNLSLVMVLSALNYSSIKAREKEEIEKKRKAAQKAQEERGEARYTTPSRSQGTQTSESGVQANYEESLG